MSFQNTIYIGDNLSIMRSEKFQKYQSAVKLIYIDPPYNTKDTKKSYQDSHDSKDWLSFMSVRLKEAKSFLKEDGVILISIDDNEYAELKICCDNIFGKENFIGTMITHQSQRSNAKLINIVHEYVLCYAKNKKKVLPFSIRRLDIPSDRQMIKSLGQEIATVFKESGQSVASQRLKARIKELCEEKDITWLKNYHNIDETGRIFFATDLSVPGTPREVNIPEINLHLKPLKTRSWATDEKFMELHKSRRLVFKDGRPYAVKYLTESEDSVPSILNFYSRQGTHNLKRLGLQDTFDTPKPVEMLKFFVRMVGAENTLILDFFAGSGSTAQAVYETNREDSRNNHYVLIQLNEKITESSKAYKKCQELNITPTIDEVLLTRLRAFLEKEGINEDFIVEQEPLQELSGTLSRGVSKSSLHCESTEYTEDFIVNPETLAE